MKLTKIQYKKLEGLVPIEKKPAKISNCEFMHAMFYIIEDGCKLRAPKNTETGTQLIQNLVDGQKRYNGLKGFRKVFTRYDKFDSIFISAIYLCFYF